MGYRSDVHGLIYDTDERKIASLVMAAGLKGIWHRVESLLETTKIKAGGITYHAIVLEHDSIKWYDEYDTTQAWKELTHLSEKLGLEYEFVRVGENHDDVYTDGSMNNHCLIYVSRQIVSDYEEIETTEEEPTNG